DVQLIDAGPLPQGWTGKNNAVACGAHEARGEWLLFTDADTVHLPGSLARALAEAKEHQAEVLSYSPEQIAVTFWEMAVLPVVFAALARQYPPSKVSDPASPIAAANGQFILIRRETYDAIGGHAAVAGEILEDVALARRMKAAGYKIRFRYGADMVRTRMYRNFAQLREGWTKNLALLFPKPGEMAVQKLFLFIAILISGAAVIHSLLLGRTRDVWPHWLWPHWSLKRGFGLPSGAAFLILLAGVVVDVRKAKFPWRATVPALFGLPMVACLLLRSKRAFTRHNVSWKGRTYETEEVPVLPNSAPTRVNHKTFMKTPLILLLIAIATIAVGVTDCPLHAQITEEPRFSTTIIDAGRSLGPLKLGDSEDRARELFPKKDIDQDWEDACGSTIDWVDSTNPVGHGDVFIRLKKGKVFQIESSSTRFQTADGITTFDAPEKVEKLYKDMRAWVLLSPPSPALGSRPPVFWIEKKRGIAFELAYDVPHHKRYVYKVIVFEPNKMFCPEQETVNSLKWQPIDAYAQEPPRELSPEP
ncbi:MAG TPA: glycosyltransferase, partial [Dongiaceae bacterium]|nr:glycosyltransferase [Dongiaceae bacterium]